MRLASLGVRSTVGVAAVSLAMGCGGSQKHAEAPTAAAAQPGQCAPAPEPAQESLLELVPDRAVAALVVRKNALAPFRQLLDSDPGQRAELATFLTDRVGVDFTRVEGLVVFSTNLGQKPTGALVLRLPQGAPVQELKLPKTSSFAGVDVVRISDAAVAASLPGALVVGSEPEVAAAITRLQGKGVAVGATSPLAALLDGAGKDADVVGAVHVGGIHDPQVAAMAANFGIADGLVVFDATPQPGHFLLKLSGDGAKLAQARDTVMQLAKSWLDGLAKERNAAVAGKDVGKGVGAIMAFHSSRRLVDELAPKLDGNSLTMRYQLPRLEGATALAAVGGALAAIAVPSFQKYMARSKTSEARSNLRALQTMAATYYEDHRKEGKKFAFPPSTSWTPSAPCCGQPDNKCAPDAAAFAQPTWKALSFSLDAPHYFQYRFVSDGKGPGAAKFRVEARADLDCDGEYSSFAIEGRVDESGNFNAGTVEGANETE